MWKMLELQRGPEYIWGGIGDEEGVDVEDVVEAV